MLPESIKGMELKLNAMYFINCTKSMLKRIHNKILFIFCCCVDQIAIFIYSLFVKVTWVLQYLSNTYHNPQLQLVYKSHTHYIYNEQIHILNNN